jgi:HEAT repeat protein
VEPLIQALSDNDHLVRYAAEEALGNIKDTRAIAPLILVINDSYAKYALGEIGMPAVEPLIQCLKNNSSGVRSNAAWALIFIKEDKAVAVEPLICALKDTDSEVRSEAAYALGFIRDTRAIEPLIQALKDNDSNVQNSANEALERIGGYIEETAYA